MPSKKTIDSKLSEHYSLEVDARDPQTLLFSYPQSVTGQAYESDYVQTKVRLEFGSRSKHYPTQMCTINPYIADEFPDLLNDPNVPVKVLLAERTFWEKAIILHKLFHQFPTKDLPTRMSRHYYDFACIVASPIFEKAMKSIDLLSDDVANCKIFFRSATAKYETAIPGSIRLKPHEALEQALRDDYEKMKIMIIGEQLSFDTIISRIEFVENRVNG